MAKISGIYQILNTLTGAAYIGSAISLSDRKINHWWALRHGRHFNRHLQNAWNRYGEPSFVFQRILINVEPADLAHAEQREIDQARKDRRALYNIRPEATSNRGLRHSDETKQRLSRMFRGRRISEAQRSQLRLAKLGKSTGPRSQAVKEKISRSRLGIVPWNKGKKCPTLGKPGVQIGGALLWAAKTHCPSGHAYDEVNTYYAKNGQRMCRRCCRERMRRKRTLNREARGVEGTSAV